MPVELMVETVFLVSHESLLMFNTLGLKPYLGDAKYFFVDV